ncbi:MAG: Twitching mobility protein [Candidatus Omnitrophica bacterium ADurb.Bin292]|jgi:twitching motility protein PilT|nr:MAG: Twitching mobility protein [Candidatus Omnitrophica bacterium ADurb.Bin292]HOG23081.1 type IV pilus twitching motility protein PilT [Candidatus Omnitrophota bacterium]HPW76682.1 type IV pilus twitching motility protein PilT [Candidatus Omnitrophota bacterium]HQB12154.1 type IV pilus twitching motility protein PilT [Candidatus Omnitrophota bacterium]
MAIEEILTEAIKRDASDIHLTVNRPVTFRMVGDLVSVDDNPLTPEMTESFAKEITTEAQRKKIEEVGGVDFGFTFGDKARFRVSCYKQQGHYAMVLRLLPSKFYSFEDIGLPPQLVEILNIPRGLVLVTGPTGSGKTTSLATMLNYINENFPRHIITAEDPVEFVHQHKKSVVTQREVGEDVPTFSEAIIKSLRQDPDVVLIGEMRDIATMESAIRAAETGHLVFSTLHTTGAPRTVDRIIDVFPPEQQAQIRAQLAGTIVAVISQVLVPKLDGTGRVAAFEIMFATPAIRNLIRESKTYQILSEIQTGSRYGMITLDDHLKQLYTQGIISYESALEVAVDPKELGIQLSKIQPATVKKKK